MRMENKGGDTLAAGGVRCQFRAAGSKVTQEAWDAIFADYDPEESKKEVEDAKKD